MFLGDYGLSYIIVTNKDFSGLFLQHPNFQKIVFTTCWSYYFPILSSTKRAHRFYAGSNPLISHLGCEHSAIILVLPGNVIMDYRFGIEEIISLSDWIRMCLCNYNIYLVHVACRSHLTKQTVHLLHAQVKDENFLSWNSSSSLNV